MALFRSKKNKNQRSHVEIALGEGILNASDTLLANIRFSGVDNPVRTIVITSAAPNEGKSTIAMALALAIGKIGKTVVLMEGDMRRRSLRRALDVQARHGLHAVLTDHATIEEAVVKTEYEGVYFLDAEQGIPNPESILNSQQYEHLLQALREKYDYVVVDTPPVTAFADASIVASKVDGVALVVREGQTEKREALYAIEALRNSGANILGAIMNCQTSASSGNYNYYYSYYYNEETVPADSEQAKEAIAKAKESAE